MNAALASSKAPKIAADSKRFRFDHGVDSGDSVLPLIVCIPIVTTYGIRDVFAFTRYLIAATRSSPSLGTSQGTSGRKCALQALSFCNAASGRPEIFARLAV